MRERSNAKRGGMSTVTKVAVGLILFACVFLPLIRMFTHFSADSAREVLESGRFFPALINSITLTLIATVIVLVLAYLLAWCVERTDMKLKGMFNVILVLPMLIPSISHGMGLIILFGQNGILTNLLGLENSIYGSVGIITGSVMYAFPVAYIMLSDVLRYEDRTVYEAADVLGIGRVRQILKITLPYMRKPLITAAFSTFSLIVTDYGVPLMIGGKTKTVSLLMYEEVIGQLDFGRGCFYGLVLLIPAIVAFITDLFNKDRASSAFVKKGDTRRVATGLNVFATVVCILVLLFALLPIGAFLIVGFAEKYPTDMIPTFKNLLTTLSKGGGEYLKNSLVIAIVTSLLGTVLAYITAYLTARMRSPLSKLLHLMVLTFMAIPGIVLGLSYVMTFSGSFISGTIVILIMVNTAHFISSPYLMMYNSFGKMNENLEAVGTTLGISRVRMLKDVFLPQSFGTALEMFSYLFVNCMMTISAVAFLYSRSTKPISLMITQFEAQAQYEYAAIVSLLILAVNILMKAVIGILKRRATRYGRKNKLIKDGK